MALSSTTIAPSSTLRSASSASCVRNVARAKRCSRASSVVATIGRRVVASPRAQRDPREVRRDLRVAIEPRRCLPRDDERRVVGEAAAFVGQRLGLQDRARAFRDARRRRVRRADERRGDRRLAGIEAARVLLEQRRRQRADADEFAAIRDEVQVRLEDLVLLPASFDRERRRGLRQLLTDRPAARRGTQVRVEQSGELHRDGRRAPRPGVHEVAPRRRSDGLPVDARVLVEAPVLGIHERRPQRRRHVRERRPGEPAHRRVGAQHLHDLAVPIGERRLAGAVRGDDVAVRRHRGRSRRERADEARDGDDDDDGRSDAKQAVHAKANRPCSINATESCVRRKPTSRTWSNA